VSKFERLLPLAKIYVMFISTNKIAAQKSATLTSFNSASSFIETKGSRQNARERTQHSRFIPKLGVSVSTSGHNKLVMVDFIISPKTLKKIIRSPKLFTKMMNEIQYIDDLPRMRKPISNIDLFKNKHLK